MRWHVWLDWALLSNISQFKRSCEHLWQTHYNFMREFWASLPNTYSIGILSIMSKYLPKSYGFWASCSNHYVFHFSKVRSFRVCPFPGLSYLRTCATEFGVAMLARLQHRRALRRIHMDGWMGAESKPIFPRGTYPVGSDTLPFGSSRAFSRGNVSSWIGHSSFCIESRVFPRETYPLDRTPLWDRRALCSGPKAQRWDYLDNNRMFALQGNMDVAVRWLIWG